MCGFWCDLCATTSATDRHQGPAVTARLRCMPCRAFPPQHFCAQDHSTDLRRLTGGGMDHVPQFFFSIEEVRDGDVPVFCAGCLGGEQGWKSWKISADLHVQKRTFSSPFKRAENLNTAERLLASLTFSMLCWNQVGRSGQGEPGIPGQTAPRSFGSNVWCRPKKPMGYIDPPPQRVLPTPSLLRSCSPIPSLPNVPPP